MPMSLAESPAHTQSDGGTPRAFCTYIAAAPVRGPRAVVSLCGGDGGEGYDEGNYQQPFPAVAGNTVTIDMVRFSHAK